jgi:hypothetical protein
MAEDTRMPTDRSEMPRVVRKVALRKQPSDFAYWQSQPYQARLVALEEIRSEYHRWRYASQPRLQRLYRIVKR